MAGFAVSDCDGEELQAAKRELNDNGRFGADVPTSDEELLQRLSLVRHGQFTNGSVVLFARQPIAWIPNVSLRLVTYAVDKSGPIANDSVMQGPAIRVLKDAIATIQQRTGVSSRFERARVERQDRPAYALFALREGLVNAIVHRDYSMPGGSVRVELSPDHLTIHNSGTLPDGWTIQDLRRTHGSHPRNPDIAQVFYLRGLMEQLGMGTQKLIAACRELGAKPPVWKAERGTVSLTLYRAPEPEASVKLSPRQAKFLESSEPGAAYKVGDYAVVCQVSERQARRELSELERVGLVEKQGKGPATAYVRTRRPVG
jgi:ATP-dependent DNA helicase RecG